MKGDEEGARERKMKQFFGFEIQILKFNLSQM